MNELSENLPTVAAQGAMVMALTAREAQEVQAMVISAKRFPRDQKAAFDRIMQACARPSLAEEAEYAYPRGGETVCGPTIRLLEVCAQNWGNIKSGFKVLSSDDYSSEVEAFAWDIETNAHEAIVFRVKHVRDTKKGQTPVTSERDIYEVVANVAARRKRKCLENLIPGDIVEAARQECAKTLGTMAQKKEKVQAMVKAYQDDFRVTRDDIERRIGKRIEAMTTPEFIQLKKIFVSLRDKMSQVTDWFPQVLDPEKITRTQADGAEVPPHAGNQAQLEAERKVAWTELAKAIKAAEEREVDVAKVLGRPSTDYFEVGKVSTKDIQVATDLLERA